LARGQDKVTSGASQNALDKLTKAADASYETAKTAEREKIDAFNAGLAEDLAAERAAAEKHLEQQPVYAAFKKEFVSLNASPREKITADQTKAHQEAIRNLFQANKEMFATAYKAANVDEGKLKKAVEKRLTPFGRKIQELSLGEMDTIRIKWAPMTRLPKLPAPLPTSLCLSPPYESDKTHTHTNVAVLGNGVDAIKESGIVVVEATAIGPIATGDNFAVTGSSFQALSGFRKLRVTATFPGNYLMQASSILGVSSTGADIVVEVTKPNGSVTRSTQELDWVLSPVLWYAFADGTFDSVTKTFDIPNSGGVFLVRVGLSSWFWAGAGSSLTISASGTVEKICVEVLK
jgi:hypothetical protein